MTESFERPPGSNAASWKYGVGWLDGTPTQRKAQQFFYVSGEHAWHRDGQNAPPAAARPEELRSGSSTSGSTRTAL